MPFCPHLCSEICHFFVYVFMSVFIPKKVHSLYRECQYVMSPFFVEPFHEKLLKLFRSFPAWLVSVRENEVFEYRIEVSLVEVSDVSERRLVSSRCCWLVHAIDEFLEQVFDHVPHCEIVVPDFPDWLV